MFSLSRLQLETAAEAGESRARRVLALRRDANFTLTTILWGNVAINVLLTLLAESVLVGVAGAINFVALDDVVLGREASNVARCRASGKPRNQHSEPREPANPGTVIP